MTSVQPYASVPVRPLLKWAGGKRQLLPALAEHYPARFSRYIEPFAGSAAVFFDLLNAGRLERRRILLADVNVDLIGAYRALRDRPSEVIRELEALQSEHRLRGEACYYEVRDGRFNPARVRLMAGGAEEAAARYPAGLAAMLIFLNRTGFNGLFRLNRQGAFNVPAGRYVAPRICDAAHLRAVADALGRPTVSIQLQGFERTLAGARAGDFVYCDPPYAPLSRTSSFANYTAGGFTSADQRRLQQAVVAACRRGAHVVVSNSSAGEILQTYGAAEAVEAGLVLQRVPARRAINSRASARGPVDEVIISNVRRDALDAVRPRMVAATLASGGRPRARKAS